MGRRSRQRLGRATRAGAVLATAYFAGAIPFSNLAARRIGRVDLRDVGSGTVSGTSLYRVTGFLPLAGAGILEVAKGSIGPALATSRRPTVAALAGGAAVCGHDWSVFLGGSGGRGISPALGAFLVQDPAGTVLLLSGMVAGRLAGETAVGSLLSYALLVPLLTARKGRAGFLAGTAVLVPLVAKRLLGNGPPPDRSAYLPRLVVDRDTFARIEEPSEDGQRRVHSIGSV
jgi:glycerol-3-phosphate acyltransferase PlsY